MKASDVMTSPGGRPASPAEIGTDRVARSGSWWLRLLSADQSPGEYIKSHATPTGDEAIRARLLAELERQAWWRRQVVTNMVVTDGVVHYWGTFDSEDQRQAARVAAESIPGVRGVQDHRMHLRELPASV